MQHTQAKRRRRAITLIELMVVIAIVALISTLGYMSFPSMSSRSIVDAADRVQGWFLAAKQQAKRDNRPTGIRLIRYVDPYPYPAGDRNLVPAAPKLPTVGNQTISLHSYQPPKTAAAGPSREFVVNLLEYIQQPDDFVGPAGSSCSTNQYRNSNGNLTPSVTHATFTGFKAANGYRAGLLGIGTAAYANAGEDRALVQAGDYVEFNRSGQVFPIQGSFGNATDQKTGYVFTNLVLGYPNGAALTPPTMSDVPYRIIRQPRRLVGEEDLYLPGNASGLAIDRDPKNQELKIDQNDASTVIVESKCSGLPSSRPIFHRLHQTHAAIAATNKTSVRDVQSSSATRSIVATCYEILFAPSGAVIGPAAGADLICLWLGNQSGTVPPVLVTIRTRTGLIAVHPVNYNAALGDYYYFARDTRASGM